VVISIWKQKKAAQAGAAFDKAIELSEQNKPAEAEAAFNSLAATAPSGYRMLARLRTAAEVAERDPQAAVKLYDDISTDRSIGALEQELARIRAAGLLVDTATYPTMLQRLEPSTVPQATFAIPHANCSRCRPGTPTIRPPRANGWI